VYLDDFYQYIKRVETEKIMDEAQNMIEDKDFQTELENLAAENGITILVTDTQGKLVYSAQYNPHARMDSLSQEIFQLFYNSALENDGEVMVEFEGNEMLPLNQSKNDRNPFSMTPRTNQGGSSSDDAATLLNPEDDGFAQNIGAEMAQSVIYVRILTVEKQDYVLMVNSVLSPVDATVSTLEIQLVIITLILLVVAVLLAWYSSRTISRSLVRLNDSAKELAKGNYDVHFQENDYAEISQLSDTLNYATGELEKTENLRRELIANVSHDLRTPLTMIKAYSEVMRDLPGENTADNVQVIIDETQRLTNLVNDMLDVSQLEAGTMTLKVSTYNFTKSVKEVLARYNKLTEQEGYSIEFICQEEVWVEADEDKMYQVLYNLINNAINYTGDDKKIYVKQLWKHDRVRMEIIDTGKGIAPADLPYIWERYYKVDKAHKRAVQGTGLGLSIVKKVLELHHAVYGVESKPGMGAAFWFELPAQKQEPSEPS
jgi:signal transduction histidine kinase